jgi:predicted secreted protein
MLTLVTAMLSMAGTVAAAPMNAAIHKQVIAVPKDPGWAKYVLLAVIWTLVIAAVIGPLHQVIQRKRLPADIIKFRGW